MLEAPIQTFSLLCNFPFFACLYLVEISIDGHIIAFWDNHYKTLISFFIAIGYYLIPGYHESFSYLSYSFH